ncbi:hypothetical protein [Sulfitobacter pacificus]|uniref:Methyltransferase n=1 Tax=Sulfitobacter pacificus TaxID=1499314 RepID=A0ABQ5VGA3_9RHOB|nr:hypothetical protein [Sulfitobacter pacificus]GLQ26117.1 hypothetical protein GCM10007927_09200 [Sulfitobacter pacificus]
MTQNRSSAVMQQRSEAKDSFDDFPTPPWATRALCKMLIELGYPILDSRVWEPACNRGYMAEPLGEFFKEIYASDINDYGYADQDTICDFLIEWGADLPKVDWIITNPPFRLAVDFILRGLAVANHVAVLVRVAFDEGRARYEQLFRDHPEVLALPFVERVVMWRGVLLDPDVPVWQPDKKQPIDPDAPPVGKMVKPSTATAYQWLVFSKDHTGPTQKQRIAPCRKLLTRPGDYPPVPEHLRKPEGALL